MNQLGQNLTNDSKKKKQAINPFAQALAERERSSYPRKANSSNILGETLAKGGTDNLDKNLSALESLNQQKDQQKNIEKQQKKELLRRKLHEQVNPVKPTEIYSANREKVAEEINKLRNDLKLLAKDVAKFHKEIDVTLMTKVVDPGDQGKYYLNFFQKLRALIMMLRQRIRSARTWTKHFNAKQKKKKRKRKIKGGLDFAANESKAAHDSLQHERFNAYSGG